jgi:hypothetical protein
MNIIRFLKLSSGYAKIDNRFENQERGDYTLEHFDKEFQERLYSEKGHELILRGQKQYEPK